LPALDVVLEFVELHRKAADAEFVATEPVGNLIVAVGVVRDQESLGAGEPPVTIHATEHESEIGNLELEIPFLGSATEIDQPEEVRMMLHDPALGKLRIVQVPVIPAKTKGGGHVGEIGGQIRLQEVEQILVSIRPEGIPMTAGHGPGAGSESPFEVGLRPSGFGLQHLHFGGELLTEEIEPGLLDRIKVSRDTCVPHGRGDVHPSVGSHQRLEPGQAPPRYQEIDVRVRPVIQRNVVRGLGRIRAGVFLFGAHRHSLTHPEGETGSVEQKDTGRDKAWV
jgi:hypothetical protein